VDARDGLHRALSAASDLPSPLPYAIIAGQEMLPTKDISTIQEMVGGSDRCSPIFLDEP
jgi:hypothetical protein